MCGIYAFISFCRAGLGEQVEQTLDETFKRGARRGPEASRKVVVGEIGRAEYIYLGFHRLAINGLNEKGMQPFSSEDGDIMVICNGEIYNYKELYKMLGDESMRKYRPGSDCQVIIDLYKEFGIDHTLSLLDGVFSFVLLDKKAKKVYCARDRIGIRALYIGESDCQPVWCRSYTTGKSFVFASELNLVTHTYRTSGQVRLANRPVAPRQGTPGAYICLDLENGKSKEVKYWHHQYASPSYQPVPSELVCATLIGSLRDAVRKRVYSSEREVCCLLSGGIDSSLIASLVAECYHDMSQKDGKKRVLETYSIGMEGSEDLKNAQLVAKFIKSKHHEVIVTKEQMFASIPAVVQAIETFDTTTIRASVGNYLVCKHIAENSKAKVVFNGDGADEVMGGYIYFNKLAKMDSKAAGGIHHYERMRLLDQIAHYDVLRSDKSIASNGLEARTPYLDVGFVQTYFGLHSQVYGTSVPLVEKELFRRAVCEAGLLPPEIANRRKEAFSDGVSGGEQSWKDDIQQQLVKLDDSAGLERELVGDITPEQAWYKKMFKDEVLFDTRLEDLDPQFKKQLETRWMPRFVETHDPSARTLDIY